MTTVYVPRLIESAEQAEALPVGTVLLHLDSQGGVDQAGVVQRGYVEYSGVREEFPDDMAVGDTALVPIEAEEEFTAMGSDNGEPWIAHVGHGGIDGSREGAEAYVRRFGGFVAHRALTGWEVT